MNWLQRGVAAAILGKASAVNRVILSGLRLPGPIEHLPYGTLSKEAYENNLTVYACVGEIMMAASSVPWVLFSNKARAAAAGFRPQRFVTKATARRSFLYAGSRQRIVRKSLDMTEVQEHPLLRLLEKPNEMQSQPEYIGQQVGFWLLSGNTYEEFLGPLTGDNQGKPQEMYNLRPDRVKVLSNTSTSRKNYPQLAEQVDPAALILGYEYRVQDTSEVFAPASVLHKKFFHPTNDFYGLSPLQVAARAYRSDNMAGDWNYALLENSARPSGAFVVQTTLGDDAYERLKAQLADDYQGGAQNAGKTMLLEGGAKWEQMSLNPLEMDWLAGASDARVRICAAYHMPPEKIGDPQHRTYNSMPEATRAMWMEAVLPVLDAIRDSYNRALAPRFGDDLFLDYDRDQIDALTEDQAAVWQRLDRSTMLSVNEKREALAYEPYDGDPTTDIEADVPVGLLPKPQVLGGDMNPTLPGVKSVERDENGGARPVARKEQRLTSRQKAARAKLQNVLKHVFKGVGAELGNKIQKIANEL